MPEAWQPEHSFQASITHSGVFLFTGNYAVMNEKVRSNQLRLYEKIGALSLLIRSEVVCCPAFIILHPDGIFAEIVFRSN